MNSNSEVSDDHIIQINQSHEQTPIATSTNSPAPKHESRGVNKMTPEELSSLKDLMKRHIWQDGWLESKSIIDKCPDMVRFPLNFLGDTALHLAVYSGKLEIVIELVKRLRPEDMLIPNSDGDTALHVAARKYSSEIVKELVKRMRPEDILIKDSSGDTALHLAARGGSLEIVKELVNHMRPEDMIIQNSSGDTALHIAVERYMINIVEELVKRMRPEDMLIQNSYGDTALHVAVSEGYMAGIVKELVKRMRPEDMLKQNSSGDTALHLAVRCSSLEIVKELVKRMRPEDMLKQNSSGDTAFHLAIRLDRIDLATLLLEKHPTTLAIARNKENLTALHMLVRQNQKILDMEGERSEGGQLFKKLWTQIYPLEHKRMIMSPVLLDAIKLGNVEAVKWIIEIQPELVTIKDPENGRNLLHLVVLYFRDERLLHGIFRQKNIFDSIPAVDKEGNNILHLAARLPQGEFEELSSLRASLQMQIDITWFKVVKQNVPYKLRTKRNNAGMKPINVFFKEHKKLSEEIKETAKRIAESGMLVSTLVATVAFAAALTVPGDKTNAWFTVFILTNAVALFTSSASLLSFLSNFTSSRFAQSELVISPHPTDPSLPFGRWLLIISVTAMVVAFIAASFLIFDHTSKWVSYAVAAMGVFPILLSRLFQYNFFDTHLWSRFYRLPAKLDNRQKQELQTELQAELETDL